MRISGQTDLVAEILNNWEPNSPLLPNETNETDKARAAGSAIAGLLRSAQIFTDEGEANFLLAGEYMLKNPPQKGLALTFMKEALRTVPVGKQKLLDSLAEFCLRLEANQKRRETAKLDLEGIAICLAPNILSSKIPDSLAKAITDIPKAQKAIKLLIQSHKELFKEATTQEPSETKIEKRQHVKMKDVFKARREIKNI